MSLTLDTTLVDIEDWAVQVPTVDDWLWTMWGIRDGASSPRCSGRRIHPSTFASAAWLNALWGFVA
jgi:hypothetical protein